MAWYHSLIAMQTAAILLSVCTDARLNIPLCSLFAPEGFSIPFVSEAEMQQHTFTPCNKVGESRKKIRRAFHWGKHCPKGFHGFVLFNNEEHNALFEPKFVPEAEHDEWKDVFHTRLPQLLRTRAYRKLFQPIFAKVNGTDAERRGDGKRRQVRLKRLLKVAMDICKKQVRASSSALKEQKQKDLELIILARNLLARHYKRLITV